MIYYTNKNVFDAALDRIRYLYDEFPNVIVTFSGGKDSTVLLQLSLIVAEEKGRLPLKVMFLDQEAEWQCTIDYVKTIMYDNRVEPLWYQIPFSLANSTSDSEGWIHCWDPDKKDAWVHPKDPISIKENTFGTRSFSHLFRATTAAVLGNNKGCELAGVRCEESPARRTGLTSFATYKYVTWGNKKGEKRQQYTFHPLYDWSYTDIWTAIHKNGWKYCKLYDYMYQYGLPVSKMRLSSVTHETAITSLQWMQEIEPATWDRLTKRVPGCNTVNQMQKNYFLPSKLPFMFKSWEEYRDHLLENLIQDEDHKKAFQKIISKQMEIYVPDIYDKLIKHQITNILSNDYHGSKSQTFLGANQRYLRSSKHQQGGMKWIEK